MESMLDKLSNKSLNHLPKFTPNNKKHLNTTPLLMTLKKKDKTFIYNQEENKPKERKSNAVKIDLLSIFICSYC